MQHHRLSRESPGRDITHAQLYVRVVNRAGRAAVLDRPRMLIGKRYGIVQGIARNTRLHRRQKQLQKWSNDGALALFHGPGADLLCQHLYVVQTGCAAGSQALAHGVKIVQQFQTLAVTRQDERYRLIVFIQRHRTDPVGVQRAGAVVLVARGPIMLAVTHNPGADRAIGAAHLPTRIADHRALQVALEPALALAFGIICP